MAGVTITVQNLSSELSDQHVESLTRALNTQAVRDYNTSCWVTGDLASPVTSVTFVAKGQPVPAGSWHIEILDTSDQEGALGYHEDEKFDNAEGAPIKRPRKASARSSRGLRADAPELPLAKVFAKTSREDGAWSSEVASHEMLEMLVDPQVVKSVRTVTNTAKQEFVIVEVGDPVQECGYTVDGFLLADFALPAWFGYPQGINPDQVDFCKAIKEPFQLAPGGYISTAPVSSPEQWTQTFGSQQQDRLSPRSRPAVPVERHVSDRQLLELLSNIDRRISNMEDVLAGLAADEAELATIVPKLIERDEAASKKLAEFEAKSAAGEVVPASEVESLKTGFDQSIASLKALLPAEPAAPDKTIYEFTPAEGVEPDDRFTASGFQEPAVPAVPAVPANPETGTPETPETPEVPAQPVLYFSGDTTAGETNGANIPGYAVYTGTVEPVPAAA